MNEPLFTNPEIQNLFAGLIAGLLLGVAHTITKRLVFIGCVVFAAWLLFEFIITGVQLTPADVQYLRELLVEWKMEIVSVIFGMIVGYSIVERKGFGA